MSISLGIIETNSIPLGILAGDEMMKAAAVELIAAQAVCPGKFVVIVSGQVAAVRASVEAGTAAASYALVDSLVLASAHDSLPAAIAGCSQPPFGVSLGIMETFSLCASVIAADTAAKAAEVSLIEVRLGRGLGGKSFVLLGGDVAAVRAATKAAGEAEQTRGLMGDSIVIPAPHKKLFEALL